MRAKGFRKILSGVALSFLLACPAFAAATFHIGVMTGTVSQSEDDLRGVFGNLKAPQFGVQ